MTKTTDTKLQTLKQRLEEAEETIRAIRAGEVDALVVKGTKGDSVYTLKSADYTYRVLVEEMEDGALTVTFEGLILYCNKNFAAIVNKPIKKVIGSSLFSYVSPGDASVFNELINSGKRKRDRGELHLKTKRGRVPVSLSIIPISHAYDSPLLSVVVTNLTQKRESEKIKRLMERFEQQAETLETILNSSEDNISLIDSKHRFLFVNPSVEKMVGRKAEDIVGKTIYKAGYLKESKRNLVEIFNKGKKLRGEYVIKTAKGKRWYEYILTPIKSNNKVQAVVTISRDITVKKEIDRQRDAFIEIASHELKTPITSMKAFTQILQKRIEKTADEKDVYLVGSINTQVKRLERLVSDILHVNRLEFGRLELNKKYFDLNKLIKKIIIDFQFTTENHFVEAKGIVKGNVYADPERIEQVVSNLLSNSIKYSLDSKKVVINISQNKNEAIVSITDYGMGISESDQERLFERFYRIRNTHQKEGFGLGLYISSEIIKRHNGKIWLKSKEGVGSTFYFSLPVKKIKQKSNSF